jgi:hypothetical protein
MTLRRPNAENGLGNVSSGFFLDLGHQDGIKTVFDYPYFLIRRNVQTHGCLSSYGKERLREYFFAYFVGENAVIFLSSGVSDECHTARAAAAETGQCTTTQG